MSEHPVTEARRLITERCLIATDIDKTLLNQEGDRERPDFLVSTAPELFRSAALGANIALLSGNRMGEIRARFLKWLVEDLWHKEEQVVRLLLA